MGAASIGPFRRFRGIAMDLFSNYPFRCFVQVLIKPVLELQIFWPEDFVDKRSGSPHDDGRAELPLVAVGFQTVPAASGNKPHSANILHFSPVLEFSTG
jgi:hypothetical protein